MKGLSWIAPGVFLLLLVTLAPSLSQAQARPAYRLGVHYDLVTPRQVNHARDGKIEVVEWFWYGCRNCYAIQKALADWLRQQQGQVLYQRLPAVTEDVMIPLARAYFAAKALGVVEQVHIPLFTALHGFRRKLDNEAALRGFFAEYGVTPQAFTRIYHSGRLDDDIRRVRILGKRVGLRGVPSFVINGHYRVDAAHVSGVPQLIDILDYLVALERGEKRGQVSY